eukprot:gene16438-18647_t
MMVLMIAQLLLSAFIMLAIAERDISPDMSVLFRNGAANGRVPRCQLLRREPNSRPSSLVTHVLTSPQRTTAGFPQAAAVLNQDIDSLAAMISLMVGNDSLPASRSYVNVLLTNTDAPGRDQYLLSQNFKATSPYLKVMGGAADALSVKTLQLNLLLPMTGLNYSLASDVAETKTSQWETALLPAGEYTAEVQIVRADATSNGGSGLRAGTWQKLSSLGAGDALDQATLRRGDEVVGCVRLEYVVLWMEVDRELTDSMPLMLNEDGSTVELNYEYRRDEADSFVSTQLLYLRTMAVPFPVSASNTSQLLHTNASLTALNMTVNNPGNCLLPLLSPKTIPLMVTHANLAAFLVPPVPAVCGKVKYYLEYVYPDRRHRIALNFSAWSESEPTNESTTLLDIVDSKNTVDRKLMASIPRILEWSNSLFPRTFALQVDWQYVIQSLSSLQSFRDLQAVSFDRVSAWTVDHVLTATLTDAEQALAGVVYDNALASYGQNFAYTESFHNTDDFVDGTDDYWDHDVTTLRDMQATRDDGVASPICVMPVVLGVLQDFNMAAAKLARMVASMKALVAQVQMLRHRDVTVTLSELLQSLGAEVAGGVVPHTLVVPLMRLYTYAMLTEVMMKNVARIYWRLTDVTECNVPCFANAAYETDKEATCDSFFDAPLIYELERFTAHPQGCAASWYPVEIARMNALVDGTSTALADLVDWMPSDAQEWSAWSAVWNEIEGLRGLSSSRIKRPVRFEQVTTVSTVIKGKFENACYAAAKDGGRAVAYQCPCSAFGDGDSLQPLTISVGYWLSSQDRNYTDLATIRLPMSRSPAVVRPASIDLYALSDDDGRTGRYHRAPVPGFDDVYQHGQRPEWLLILLHGRSS